VFSSTVFLFLFLPFVIGINFILKQSLRNVFILLCSLFFYAWGENVLVLLMMGSICVNYVLGLLLSFSNQRSNCLTSKIVLFIGVALNLLVLMYYKYIHFILDNLRSVGVDLDLNIGNVILPIGVSFFTF